jgi:hypothetical protein
MTIQRCHHCGRLTAASTFCSMCPEPPKAYRTMADLTGAPRHFGGIGGGPKVYVVHPNTPPEERASLASFYGVEVVESPYIEPEPPEQPQPDPEAMRNVTIGIDPAVGDGEATLVAVERLDDGRLAVLGMTRLRPSRLRRFLRWLRGA